MAVDTGRCGACLARNPPAAIEQCVAAVDYAYPWDAVVARLKFRRQPGWAGPMARLMLQAPEAARLLRHCDAMVPVPLAPARLASRGYNQAWELVKALRRQAALDRQRAGRALGEGLLRVGDAPDQHSLPRAARLRNLRGAFVANPPALSRLAGSHVLLVDDVTTTGATLQAAGEALLSAGARRVSALVFARTPSD